MSTNQRLKIVSGGQSGVDRAALDCASGAGLASGGWCPRGRQAEDGMIDSAYPLLETPSDQPGQRTEWNVRDSDATLVLSLTTVRSPGTDLTTAAARHYRRPFRQIDLGSSDADVEGTRRWLRTHDVRVLNVAGPRQSEVPGAYALASKFLQDLLTGGPR